MNELEQIKKNAGIVESVSMDQEVYIDGFGGLPLNRVIEMIKEDAAKLDPATIKKSDILFIRNGSKAIARIFDKPNLMDSEITQGTSGTIWVNRRSTGAGRAYKLTPEENDALFDAMHLHPAADRELMDFLMSAEDENIKYSETLVISYKHRKFSLYAMNGHLRLGGGGPLTAQRIISKEGPELVAGLINDFKNLRIY